MLMALLSAIPWFSAIGLLSCERARRARDVDIGTELALH